LNPDYELDEFVYQDFATLRSHCNHITIYGDVRDRALWFSEIYNRKKCLGKRIFDLRLTVPTTTTSDYFETKKGKKKRDFNLDEKMIDEVSFFFKNKGGGEQTPPHFFPSSTTIFQQNPDCNKKNKTY